MANTITGNVWRLDTVGVITADAVVISSIRWVGASSAAHAAILKDGTGKVMWEAQAQSADYSEESLGEQCIPWRGLTLDTLGSGILYIYLA